MKKHYLDYLKKRIPELTFPGLKSFKVRVYMPGHRPRYCDWRVRLLWWWYLHTKVTDPDKWGRLKFGASYIGRLKINTAEIVEQWTKNPEPLPTLRFCPEAADTLLSSNTRIYYKDKRFVLDPDEAMVLRSFMIPITLESELATIAYKTRRSKSEVVRDLIIIGLNSEYAGGRTLNEIAPELRDGTLVNRTANFPIKLDGILKERARTEKVSKNELIRQLLYKGLQFSQLEKSQDE